MKKLLLLLLVLTMGTTCSSNDKEKADQAKSDYHYKLGVNYYMDNNITAALAELYQSLGFNEQNAKSHHMLGFIYLGRRQYSDSLKHLARAVELDPKFFEARSNYGALMLAMENWDQAIELLSPMLNEPLFPTPYLLHNNLGWAYFNLKKYALAEKSFKMALFLNPKMCLAYNNLGMVHEQQRKYQDAQDAYSEAVKSCPGYQEPLFHMAVMLQNLNRPEDARVLFEKCVKISPDAMYGRRCRGRL